MNKVNITGRITKDLEIKEAGENKYVRFSIAVDKKLSKEEKEKREKDNKPTADFISCVGWNKCAETLAQYFKKGSLIGITGRLQTGSYDKSDGTKGYTTDVIIEEFDFLEKKGDERPAPEFEGTPIESKKEPESDPYAEFSQEVEVKPEDLPF